MSAMNLRPEELMRAIQMASEIGRAAQADEQSPIRVDERKNQFAPGAFVSSEARIGSANFFGPGVIIGPSVQIGSCNVFEGSCYIGGASEPPTLNGSRGIIRIGDENTFRTFSVVNLPRTAPATQIGCRTRILHGAHVSGGCFVFDEAVLGARSYLEEGAMVFAGVRLGGGSYVEEERLLGPFSSTLPGAFVARNLEPFHTYGSGQELQSLGVLEKDIRDLGFSASLIQTIVTAGWRHCLSTGLFDGFEDVQAALTDYASVRSSR